LVILVATLAAMTLAGCSVGLPPDVAGLGYIDRSDHVAMNVPAGWQAREFTGQVPLVLTAPGPDEPGRPNVSVTVVPGWRHLTLEDMVEDGRPGLKRLTGFRRPGLARWLRDRRGRPAGDAGATIPGGRRPRIPGNGGRGGRPVRGRPARL
jgi:hypothetical protein